MNRQQIISLLEVCLEALRKEGPVVATAQVEAVLDAAEQAPKRRVERRLGQRNTDEIEPLPRMIEVVRTAPLDGMTERDIYDCGLAMIPGWPNTYEKAEPRIKRGLSRASSVYMKLPNDKWITKLAYRKMHKAKLVQIKPAEAS